jgi:hypothetical protein
MKKNIIFIILFFGCYQLFANYTGNITIYQNNLKYSKVDSFDLVSITVEGALKPDEIEAARANCPAFKEEVIDDILIENNDNQNINLANNNDSPWLNAKPNPINESSVIAVNTASDADCIVEITDLYGRLIKSIKVKGGYSEVKIPRSELSIGIYNISLLENGKKVAVSKMTVEYLSTTEIDFYKNGTVTYMNTYTTSNGPRPSGKYAISVELSGDMIPSDPDYEIMHRGDFTYGIRHLSPPDN